MFLLYLISYLVWLDENGWKIWLMTVNNTYQSVYQHQHQHQQKRHQQQNFGNAFVGLATFIENNGFLGEFLTVDTVGMAAPRTIQGYNRNKEELGHLNYKAGREEMVRELLSGPAFFFVPAIVLGIVTLIKGKATQVTTGTLEVFKSVMKKATPNIKDIKDSKEIKKKFIDEFISNAFDEKEYKNERGQVAKIKEILSEATDYKSKNFLGLFDKKKKGFKEDIAKAITTLNKANGKFIDSTTMLKITTGKDSAKLNSVLLLSDMPNYLEHITKSASGSKIIMEKFVDKFHKTVKRTRQTTNILAAIALSAFLLVIPKIYQTGKEFPGIEGLKTQEPSTKGGSK